MYGILCNVDVDHYDLECSLREKGLTDELCSRLLDLADESPSLWSNLTSIVLQRLSDSLPCALSEAYKEDLLYFLGRFSSVPDRVLAEVSAATPRHGCQIPKSVLSDFIQIDNGDGIFCINFCVSEKALSWLFAEQVSSQSIDDIMTAVGERVKEDILLCGFDSNDIFQFCWDDFLPDALNDAVSMSLGCEALQSVMTQEPTMADEASRAVSIEGGPSEPRPQTR